MGLSFIGANPAHAAPASGAFTPDAVVDLNFKAGSDKKGGSSEPSFEPDQDPCARTAYGETLYPDSDLIDFAEVDIEEEYKLARMAFLFGRYDYAYKIWEPLAYQGNPKAQATLGWMFHTGKGVRKNLKRALMWYRAAAKQNHIVAQNNVGVFYEQGVGVRKSYRKAAKWYREAAEMGYPYAQYNLGVLYHRGKGVKKNRNEAIFWLQIASLQGVKQARRLLEDWGNLPKKHKNVKPIVRFHSSKKHKELTQKVKGGKDKQGKKSSKKSTKKQVSPHDMPIANKNKKGKKTSSKKVSKKTNNNAKRNLANNKKTRKVAKAKSRKPTKQVANNNSEAKSRPKSSHATPAVSPRSRSSVVRDANWVLQQNPDHYTVQLAGSTDLKALLTIASKVSTPSRLAHYSISSKKTNKEWFNLLYGRYRTKKAAQMQLDGLPPELKQYKPWITKFSDVQKRLK